jgi:hypothetical protein
MNSGLRSRRPGGNSPSPRAPQVSAPSGHDNTLYRSDDAPPSAASTDGTSSSLGGTKQWLDDVLSASLRRGELRGGDDAAARVHNCGTAHYSEPRRSFGDEVDSTPREPTHNTSTMSSVHFFSTAPQQQPRAGSSHLLGGSSESCTSSAATSSDTDECEDFIVKQDNESIQTRQGNGGDDERHDSTSPPFTKNITENIPASHRSRHSYSQRIFSICELLSLYKLLDGDNNGVVSTLDLFGFLSLHPQSIDLTVEKFFHTGHHSQQRGNNESGKSGPSRQQRTAAAGGEEDTSIPALVPHAGISLLSSCPRGSIRDPILYQKFCQRRFRRGEVPLTSDLLGPTWWVQQRLRADECAQRFVSFVLQMTSGLAQRPLESSRMNFASPSGGLPRHHNGIHRQGPSVCGASSFGSPKECKSGDGNIVVVPHITFFSFQQLYYHCTGLLRGNSSGGGGGGCGGSSYMFAALDLPMLRKLLWFYEFLDVMSRSSGRQWDWILHHDPDEIKARKLAELFGNDGINDHPNRAQHHVVTRLSRVADSRSEITVEDAQWVQCRFHYVQDLIESGVLDHSAPHHAAHDGDEPPVMAPLPTSPQPLYTSLPAVYWTFAAWDVPRGWFDVSVLQRLGERYMRHHTLRHARIMRQFLRQMWVSQHNAIGGGARQHVTARGHLIGNWSDERDRDFPAEAKQSRSSAPTMGMRMPPAASVAEKLALVQLSNRFLSFHHIQDRSSSGSGMSSKSSAVPSSAASSLTLHSGGSSSILASSSSAMFSDTAGSGVFEKPAVPQKKTANDRKPPPHRRVGSSTTILVDEGCEGGGASAQSSASMRVGAGNGLSSLVSRVARDGVNVLWETMSSASTQASPHRPLLRRTSWQHQQPTSRNEGVGDEGARRPASTTAASLHLHTEADSAAIVNGGDFTVETVVRQSLLHHDLTLHTILAPDMTLSAIPSMSGGDREWLRRETRNLIIRAGVYALFSAILISLVDVMAQAWILQNDTSFLDTSAFSNFENLFSFTGLTTTAGVSQTTDVNGTIITTTVAVVTPLSTIIKYYVAVVVGTLVFSLVEVLFLYLDTLQFCFKMAQTCGIPLEAAQREHHHNSSSHHHSASVKALKASFARAGAEKGKKASRWETLRSAVSGIIDAMAIGGGGGRHGSPSSSGGFHIQDQLRGGPSAGSTQVGGLDDDNRELRVIRQHLVRRRVRFVIAAITRCAMQIGFDPTTVLGLDVRDRNVSRIRLALSILGERIKRVAPSVVLRLLATRLLHRLLVPFVAVPVLVAWNIILTQRSVFQARLVSLGTIGVERIARELLSSSFSITARVSQHNARVFSAPSAAARNAPSMSHHSASAAVQVPSTRALFHVPYHCLQEMLMMVVFFSHCVQGPKEIHPFVHSLLVELLSSCELPDVCLWMIPKEKSVASPSRRRRRDAVAKQKAAASSSAYDFQRQRSCDAAMAEDELTTPLQHSAKTKRGGGPVNGAATLRDAASTIAADPTVSEALSPPRAGVADSSWSKVLDLALLDVGGSAQCALSATLRTFTRELNRLRAASCESSSTADWLHLYVEACPWPMELVQRIELRDHIRSWTVLHPQRVDDARFNFLVESTFPSWASPSSMGPTAHQRRMHQGWVGKPEQRRGVATEVFTPSKTVIEIFDDGSTALDDGGTNNGDVFSDSDCTVELEHAAASDALRSATIASPFSLEHVKLFLTLGILLVVTTYAPKLLAGALGAHPGPSSSRRLCRYLLHLRASYIAALRNAKEFAGRTNGGGGGDHHTSSAMSYQDMHPVHCELFLHSEQVNFLRGVDTLHAAFWAGCPCLTVAEIHRIIDTTAHRR